MDELEFRRRLLADPHDKDPALLSYANAHPELKSMTDELKRFDGDIERALKIPVPENLAERIILKQCLHKPKRRMSFDRMHLALAASVMFAVGALVYNHFQPPLTEGEHALAHVYHEIKSLDSQRRFGLDEVNAKLARFNGNLGSLPGEVSYVTECNFKGQKGLHLVFNTPSGPVTLFIVPGQNSYLKQENFIDQRFAGLIEHQQRGDVILVASHQAPLDKYSEEVAQSLRWL